MSIVLDTLTFGRLLDLVMPGTGPSPAEVRTILQLGQLAAGIDLDDDDAERSLLGAMTRRLCASAEIPISSVPVLSPLPGDAEERNAQIVSLASRLVTTQARELAFVMAYLLIVSDLELAPLELELLEALRCALCIDGSRATDLLAEASELVTPGARAELEHAAAHS
jgi:hypothetical protein